MTLTNSDPELNNVVSFTSTVVFPFLSKDKRVANLQLIMFASWNYNGVLFMALSDPVRTGRVTKIIENYLGGESKQPAQIIYTFQYDKGRLIGCATNINTYISFHYDDQNRLENINQMDEAGEHLIYNFYYNSNDTLNRVDASNTHQDDYGYPPTTTWKTETVEYSSAGQVSKVNLYLASKDWKKVKLSEGESNAECCFIYNSSNGRLKEVDEFMIGPSSERVKTDTWKCAYDSNGNITNAERISFIPGAGQTSHYQYQLI